MKTAAMTTMTRQWRQWGQRGQQRQLRWEQWGGHKQQSTKGYEAAKKPAVAAAALTAAKMT
jgi:hypothetical protein